MADIELISYMAVFALSVIFSFFAFEQQTDVWKNSIFSWLGAVCWFVLSAVHLALTQTSSFIILSWMFVALGFIFVLYGFYTVFLNFRIRKRQKEWELA